MEINIYSPEGKLSEMIKNLIEKEDNLSESGESTPPGAPNNEGSLVPPEIMLKYPEVESGFFKGTEIKSSWWEKSRLYIAFGFLVGFAVYVFLKLYVFVGDKDIPSKNLLFFFGVIALLFVGLVVLAYFLIKADEKHHSVENERENKMLAFRLKMMESAFELENRKNIAEKHRMEKEIIITDKEKLYALDEQQRAADHIRRMQFRKYEILENYMKHLVELAKTTEKKPGE